MSPTMKHYALAAALLWVSAASGQQQPNAQGSSFFSPSGSQTGVFKPADASNAAATQATPVIGLDKEYRVGPNDLLEIEVMNLENGKRTVRVNNAGYITLPLIGSVTVAGLTQQQLESHIAGLYGEKYLQSPQVAVFIREFTTDRITIDGAISKPGIYPLVGQLTLLRALAQAGGFGSIANTTEVKVFRQENGKRVVATFDVDRIRAGKDVDPPLKGDDLIVVQRDATRALIKDSVFRDIMDTINPFSIFGR